MATLSRRMGVAVLLTLGLAACGRARGESAREPTNPGFAVLELFTSEGCSSCPPADALLAELTAQARSSGRAVHTLSFHVDYWDDIGWRDPFSDRLYSARQRAYARAGSGRGVYTPQLVINGREALVGSDAARVRASVDGQLRARKPLALTLSAASQQRQVSLQYQLSAAPPAGAVLQVALLQPAATSQVVRGENSGRSLHHVNVVRAFRTQALDGHASGAVQLTRPAELSGANLMLTAYVQDSSTLEILGAASLALAP